LGYFLLCLILHFWKPRSCLKEKRKCILFRATLLTNSYSSNQEKGSQDKSKLKQGYEQQATLTVFIALHDFILHPSMINKIVVKLIFSSTRNNQASFSFYKRANIKFSYIFTIKKKNKLRNIQHGHNAIYSDQRESLSRWNPQPITVNYYKTLWQTFHGRIKDQWLTYSWEPSVTCMYVYFTHQMASASSPSGYGSLNSLLF